MALIAEAAELLEHFKWHNEAGMKSYIAEHKEEKEKNQIKYPLK